MIPLAVVWVCLLTSGQIGLLLLLVTLFSARSPALPQARNPHFMNFLLITFVKSVPESVIFFSTNARVPAKWECLLQIGIVNGAPVLYHSALLVLVFHTWVNVRVGTRGAVFFTLHSRSIRILLLMFPYFVFAICATMSIVGASRSTQMIMMDAMCIDETTLGNKIRNWLTYYGLAVGGTSLILESWMIYVIFKNTKFRTNLKGAENEFSNYRISLVLYARLFVFCTSQLIMLLLTSLVTVVMVRSETLLMVQAIVEVSDALQIFLIFGTQRNILETWGRWSPGCFSGRSKMDDEESQSQMESYDHEHYLPRREVPSTIP